MKKMIIFALLAIVSVGGAFAETRKITVEQSIRYSDGTFAPLLTPQISKAKAIKSNKGKVVLRYDFSVEQSSSRNDIATFIYLPMEVPFYPTAIEGATPLEKAAEKVGYDISGWTIVQECLITNVYRTEADYPMDFIEFDLQGKKGTKATVEFLLDVSNWPYEELPIRIKFFPNSRSRGLMGFLRDSLIIPLISDAFSGEFKDNPYEDSNRTFTLLLTK